MGYAKDVYTVPASLAGTFSYLHLTSPHSPLYHNVTSCHVGLPAISVPVGFAANGMPFGLQLIGQVGPSLPPFTSLQHPHWHMLPHSACRTPRCLLWPSVWKTQWHSNQSSFELLWCFLASHQHTCAHVPRRMVTRASTDAHACIYPILGCILEYLIWRAVLCAWARGRTRACGLHAIVVNHDSCMHPPFISPHRVPSQPCRHTSRWSPRIAMWWVHVCLRIHCAAQPPSTPLSSSTQAPSQPPLCMYPITYSRKSHCTRVCCVHKAFVENS